MKAALLYGIGEPLRIEDYPRPQIGANDALVRVKAAGICGTDLHIIDGEFALTKLPLILGHEVSGDIEEVGKNITEYRVGDRVLVAPARCGVCHYCQTGRDNLCENAEGLGHTSDGGFAEFIRVPAKALMKIPEGISYEEAAISVDSLAAPFHALRYLGVRIGDTIAIYGIGGLGMNAVQLGKLTGARVIAVDIYDEKLELAKEVGADEIINSKNVDPVQRIRELTGGEGADMAFEVIGLKATIEQAIRSVRRGGKIGIIGGGPEEFCVPIRLLLWNSLSIIACFGALRSEFPIFLELVRMGKINLKRMITHTFSLEEANLALKTLREKIGSPIRVVLKPIA